MFQKNNLFIFNQETFEFQFVIATKTKKSDKISLVDPNLLLSYVFL